VILKQTMKYYVPSMLLLGYFLYNSGSLPVIFATIVGSFFLSYFFAYKDVADKTSLSTAVSDLEILVGRKVVTSELDTLLKITRTTENLEVLKDLMSEAHEHGKSSPSVVRPVKVTNSLNLFHKSVLHTVTNKSGIVADTRLSSTEVRVKWSEGGEVSPWLSSTDLTILN
jgi:hypothetical protein